jgi:hypothetical protein
MTVSQSIIKKLPILLLFAVYIFIISCNEKSSQSNSVNFKRDTIKPTIKSTLDSSTTNKEINSSKEFVDRPDSEQESMSPKDEMKRIERTYNIVKKIDTILFNGQDTLHLHIKYYCLKKDTLIIPKSLNYSNESFLTHPFASRIILINGKDTVVNKEFKAQDFTKSIADNYNGNLKRYGSIIKLPIVSSKNKNDNQVSLAYTISIPGTDIGQVVHLIISKNGEYKILEHL